MHTVQEEYTSIDVYQNSTSGAENKDRLRLVDTHGTQQSYTKENVQPTLECGYTPIYENKHNDVG